MKKFLPKRLISSLCNKHHFQLDYFSFLLQRKKRIYGKKSNVKIQIAPDYNPLFPHCSSKCYLATVHSSQILQILYQILITKRKSNNKKLMRPDRSKKKIAVIIIVVRQKMVFFSCRRVLLYINKTILYNWMSFVCSVASA